MDSSLPDSPVHGLSQARILEQVAIYPVSPTLVGGFFFFFTTKPPWRPFILNIMFLLFCPVGGIAEYMVANIFPWKVNFHGFESVSK